LKRERELSKNVIQNASKPTLKISTVSNIRVAATEDPKRSYLKSAEHCYDLTIHASNKLGPLNVPGFQHKMIRNGINDFSNEVIDDCILISFTYVFQGPTDG
jgi:hypothetical protein